MYSYECSDWFTRELYDGKYLLQYIAELMFDAELSKPTIPHDQFQVQAEGVLESSMRDPSLATDGTRNNDGYAVSSRVRYFLDAIFLVSNDSTAIFLTEFAMCSSIPPE